MKNLYFSVLLVIELLAISPYALAQAGTECPGNLDVGNELTATAVGVGTTDLDPLIELEVDGDVRVSGAFVDTSGDSGSFGQVLSSTGAGTDWVDPSQAPTGGVFKTGQTTSYGTNDDGDLEEGVTWANPRFTDNSDGTVTDNNTGLIWLKNADCGGTKAWSTALTYCNSLSDGTCGLSDGSAAGNWRLPNLFELESLRDMAYSDPVLSNAAGTAKWTNGSAFTNVQSGYYWSSTTYADYTNAAWNVGLRNGDVYYEYKPSTFYVWPVRSGN